MRPELISQPITGICSFGRYPICLDLTSWMRISACWEFPSTWESASWSGARMGPRRVREASTQYGRGTQGYYDYEADEQLLAAPVSIADCGDADVLQGDRDYSFHCIERAVRRIIRAGTIPHCHRRGPLHQHSGGQGAGGVPQKEICVIQFDAHLDWTSHVGPLVQGNGSPMRRMSEMEHIEPMVQIGLRGMGSGKKQDYDDARAYGSSL